MFLGPGLTCRPAACGLRNAAPAPDRPRPVGGLRNAECGLLPLMLVVRGGGVCGFLLMLSAKPIASPSSAPGKCLALGEVRRWPGACCKVDNRIIRLQKPGGKGGQERAVQLRPLGLCFMRGQARQTLQDRRYDVLDGNMAVEASEAFARARRACQILCKPGR